MSGVLALLAGGSLPGIVGAGYAPAPAATLASVYSRVLAAVRNKLVALPLADMTADRVLVKKLLADRQFGAASGPAFPLVVITPEQATADPLAGNNVFEDVTYRVRITLMDRDNQEPSMAANLDRTLAWHEQIARAFRAQRLAGVAEVYAAGVEPTETIRPEAWMKNLLVSSLVLRFTSREPRGL